MPNVDAANITYNALRVTSGGGITVGGILLGAAKPVAHDDAVVDGAARAQHDRVRRGGRGRKARIGGRAGRPVRAAFRQKRIERTRGTTRRQTSTPKPFYKSLYLQVITAIVIGVILGHFYPQTGEAMKPLGDAFIKLIKMIIAPIIFCTVVVGIAGMEDMKKVGKTGGLALLYFEVVSSVALIVGLAIINLVQPGAGMNVDPSTLDTKSISAFTGPGKMQGTVDFLMNIIPNTVVDAFAKGEILQVLLFSVMFGLRCTSSAAAARWCSTDREELARAVLDRRHHHEGRPIGAFGAMAFTIGKYGVGSLLSLAS
jgi:aerobic C4-dicarboxylate transport protein